jgi:hypothetical protein
MLPWIGLIYAGLLIAWAVASSFPALAYRPGGQVKSVPTTTAASVGTTSTQVLPVDAQRSSLWVCNVSTTTACAMSHGSFGAAALNTAGSVSLAAGGCAVFDNTKNTDSINVICASPSTPITAFAWD